MRGFDEILHEDHICIYDAEQVAIAILARKLKHGRDQRRTAFITLHLRNMLHAEVTRGFGETCLFAKQ